MYSGTLTTHCTEGEKMAIADGKRRVQVTFGDEVLERLDRFCRDTGMTRSSYITYIVATSLQQYENLSNAAADGVKQAAMRTTE